MPDQLLGFLAVAVLLTVSPGPDTALGIRNSLRGGSSAMWWTGLGACSGIFVHAVASVIGLSAILAASAKAYAVIKIAGAAYLVWLGAMTLWRTWRDRGAPHGDVVASAGSGGEGVARREAFRQGFVSDVLNPKIALLFLTMLPQFISPGEPRVLTSVMLTIAFVTVALLWWRVTSWLAGALRTALTKDKVRTAMEGVTGTVMVALGVRVATE